VVVEVKAQAPRAVRTSWNAFWILRPRRPTTAMMTPAMRATSRPYSTAVAPFS